ncbi:hypothetical protein ER308_07260 [Egibacter rhizosphaerae]|uniref:PD-(D/E)XK endonuclease-like domain-containing protein n=1 Tax=Egibacter rhizosphaerae TaxID=1670831 RepID=A0A411YDR3_9ACTN|nr:hypothetical protein [Egibacter rhizosphaerae]QBI19363.1 hypothetical protein ER308_07260 [Egibacter rhizosphaerae]
MSATPHVSALSKQPSPQPVFAPILAERWTEERVSEDPKEHAVAGTRVRHSDAGKCSRAIGYRVLGVDETNPTDMTGWWNMGIGTILHDQWQEEAQRRWPHAEVEVKVRADPNDDVGSGHVDLEVRDGPVEGLASVEVKTIGGYGFKRSVGAYTGRKRQPPEGPRFDHIVQGAVNAHSKGADRLVIVYLSKEAISAQSADRDGIPDHLRIVAEWHYEPEEFTPIALGEIERWRDIVEAVDAGYVPPRYIPEHVDVVTNPETGRMSGGGKYPLCAYCTHRDQCINDG